MANPTKRLIWLLETLERGGRMTAAEIDSAWSRAGLNDRNESRLPRRTLQNQIAQIKDIFNITIKCDRTDSCYYISDTGSLSNNLLQSLIMNEANMMDSGLNERVHMGIPNYHNRSVSLIMEAMREGRTVLITKKTWYADEDEAILREQYPYYDQLLVEGEIELTTEIQPYYLDYPSGISGWFLIGYVPKRERIEVFELSSHVSLSNNHFESQTMQALDSIRRDCFLYIKKSDLDLYDDRLEYSEAITGFGSNFDMSDEEYDKYIAYYNSQ